MAAQLEAIRESSFAGSVSLREAVAARVKASVAAAPGSSCAVEVVVSASSPTSPFLDADRQHSGEEDSRPAAGLTESSKVSFLRRASRRIRRRWVPPALHCPAAGTAAAVW